MTKKRFTGVVLFWKGLETSIRFAIISILCGLIAFGIIAINEDWSRWVAKEENYEALEKIAYDIIESENISQPISENLKNYNVSVNNDGTIYVDLYSNDVEHLRITISEDFKIQSLQRNSRTLWYVMMLIFLLAIIGTIVSAIVHLIYFIFKKIYMFIKNKPENSRE